MKSKKSVLNLEERKTLVGRVSDRVVPHVALQCEVEGEKKGWGRSRVFRIASKLFNINRKLGTDKRNWRGRCKGTSNVQTAPPTKPKKIRTPLSSVSA